MNEINPKDIRPLPTKEDRLRTRNSEIGAELVAAKETIRVLKDSVAARDDTIARLYSELNEPCYICKSRGPDHDQYCSAVGFTSKADRLTRERDEAREDSARLDWYERFQTRIRYVRPYWYSINQTDSGSTGQWGNIRDAIDDARGDKNE